LAAEIKSKYGVDSELVAGHNGIFDVHIDDELVFSRHEEARFPDHQEIFEAIDGKS
jgi:selT/selW/selH-like putative selenoprotein